MWHTRFLPNKPKLWHMIVADVREMAKDEDTDKNETDEKDIETKSQEIRRIWMKMHICVKWIFHTQT